MDCSFFFLEGVNSYYSFLLIYCSLAINNSLLQHHKYKSLSDNSCWTKHASKQQLNVSLLVPNSLHAIYYSAGITHQDVFYNSPLACQRLVNPVTLYLQIFTFPLCHVSYFPLLVSTFGVNYLVLCL